MSQSWSTAGVDLFVETGRTRRRASLEQGLRDAIQSRRLAPGPGCRPRAGSPRTWGSPAGPSPRPTTSSVPRATSMPTPASGTVVADLGPLLPPSVPAPRPGPRPAMGPCDPGTPDVTAFPLSTWLRATRTALDRAPSEAFGYGSRARPPRAARGARSLPGSDPRRPRRPRPGRRHLRVHPGADASRLRPRRPASPPPSCHGEPLLRLPPRRPRPRRARVVPLDVDDEGMRTDQLSTDDLAGSAAVVVSPAHQYPTGETLPPDRRRDLLAWARRTGGLVVEDDYDGEFRYDRRPSVPSRAPPPTTVAYLGTASKVLSPALRLAWLVASASPRRARHRGEALCRPEHRHPAQLTLAEMFASHAYDRQVRTMRSRYRRRHDALIRLVDSLRGEASRGCSCGASAPACSSCFACRTGRARMPSSGQPPRRASRWRASAGIGTVRRGATPAWCSASPVPPNGPSPGRSPRCARCCSSCLEASPGGRRGPELGRTGPLDRVPSGPGDRHPRRRSLVE